MLEFVVFSLRSFCLGLPLYWGVMLLASLSGHYRLVGAHGFKFMICTVAAACGIVWVNARRRIWTRVAFGVLSVGMLRLLLAFNVCSLYAVVIWYTGLLLMEFERKRQTRLPGQMQTHPVRTDLQQPHAPADSSQPDYDYSHLVSRARCGFADIVGMTDTKNRVLAAAKEILSLQDQPDGKVSGQSRRPPRNGILFFGDPGNGKTLFAEALAGELGLRYISIAYGDIASRWINDTPQRVKAVFDLARCESPILLFIDELDSFVKDRSSGRSHSMDHDLANVMLTEIVALRGTSVVLVAATNFIDDSLDRAAIREGRFDYKIEVPPPDFAARKALLARSICRELGQDYIDAETLTTLAQRWEGFNASRLDALGAQLRDMCANGSLARGRITYDAAMKAMRLLQGRKGKLPEDVKPIDEIIMPGRSRDMLRDLAFRMKNVHSLERIGGRVPTGLVFAGPPGTGKTQAAMSLARESGYAFLSTTGEQIIARPESWDMLVSQAREIRPTIALVDEGDVILRSRTHSNVSALTNKILTTLDGAEGRVRDIVYILTTNYLNDIDPAALRGGRFEETIMFDVPDENEMVQYASAQLKRLAGGTYVIMPGTRMRLSELLVGKSIADANAVLQKTVDAAAVRALRESVNEIRASDVESAAASVFTGRTFQQ